MKRTLFISLFSLAASTAFAQVTVTNPWVRATVPQQKATGAFLQIKSAKDARLVEARSPAANVVELHEMTMVDNVMKMRATTGVALPAGQLVELKPGGHHVMLVDLKQPIKEGDRVHLTLVIEDKDHKRETIEVNAVARPLTAVQGPGSMKH
jgi:periplasmic copper chaperone A